MKKSSRTQKELRMSVRGLSGNTVSWIQQRGQTQPQKATFSEDKARKSSNELQVIEQEGTQEFSKDELKRMREFMSSIGERVDSIDGAINNFERIDTKRPNPLVHPTFLSPYPGYFLTTSPETSPARPLPFKMRRSC
jgi:hypothetical protein